MQDAAPPKRHRAARHRADLHKLPHDPIETGSRAVAAALNNVAEAMREATLQRKAADEFFGGLAHRLDGLCRFLGKFGPWLLASCPLVLAIIGAVTPRAAEGIARVIKVLFP